MDFINILYDKNIKKINKKLDQCYIDRNSYNNTTNLYKNHILDQMKWLVKNKNDLKIKQEDIKYKKLLIKNENIPIENIDSEVESLADSLDNLGDYLYD